MDERLLLPDEVAERLRVSRVTVMRLLRRGTLKGIKTGKLWRIRETDVEAFIKTRERGGTASLSSEEEGDHAAQGKSMTRSDEVAQTRHAYMTDSESLKEAAGRGLSLLVDQDDWWLSDKELQDLPPYDWGPSGPPKSRQVRYVDGIGLIVEGGKRSGR